MAVIAVLHGDARARAALRLGLPRRGTRMRTCRSPDSVRRLLRRELVDAVVVDVLEAAPAADTFALVADFPAIPVFALSRFRPDDGRLLAACRAAGLRAVLVDGVDHPVAGALIAARTAGRRRWMLLRDAAPGLRLTEPLQQRAWEEIFLQLGGRITTSAIAGALRRTREHLSREFAAGGAPNLKRAIDLVRTMCAADLLANPGYDVQTVARVLRCSSGSHLAGLARRIAGWPPAELGTLGPNGVLQRFLKGRTRSRI